MTTAEEFKSLVEAYGGVECLLGLGFDNSSSVTFNVGDFSYSSCLDEERNLIKLINYDRNANTYITLKPIENIQSIIMMPKQPAGSSITLDSYDKVNLRG